MGNKLGSGIECEDCGEQILKARLKLLPDTETCVLCQESRERKGKFQKYKMSVNYKFKGDEIEETLETLVRAV